MKEFGEHGYAGASLNVICAEGISKGLLYHNFENRDALYLACAEKCFSDLFYCLKNADIEGNPQKYMAARLQFFGENEYEARIFFESVLQPPDSLRNRLDGLRAEFDALNLKIYQDILSSLTLRKGISNDDALKYFEMQQTMFGGYFSGPAVCRLSLPEKMRIHEKELSKLLDMMFYGIAERSGNQ